MKSVRFFIITEQSNLNLINFMNIPLEITSIDLWQVYIYVQAFILYFDLDCSNFIENASVPSAKLQTY